MYLDYLDVTKNDLSNFEFMQKKGFLVFEFLKFGTVDKTVCNSWQVGDV